MVCLCLLGGQDNDLSLVNGVGVHKTVGVALEDGLVLHQTGICLYNVQDITVIRGCGQNLGLCR